MKNVETKKHKKGSINSLAFWPAFAGLILLLLIGIFFKEQLASVLNTMLYSMADKIGWVINLFALVCFLIVMYIMISKFGDIKIGGKDAKPEFTKFHWIAMTICGSCCSGPWENRFITFLSRRHMPAASLELVMLRSSRSLRLCGSGLLLNLRCMEPVLWPLRLLFTTAVKNFSSTPY